jgi:N-acetylneuraminic acid mutarotase
MDVNSFIVGYTKGKQSASGGGGSGVELNIAYGDIPPEDTTKLWVKKSNFTDLQIVPRAPDGGGAITMLEEKTPYAYYSKIGGIGTKVYLFKFGENAVAEVHEYDTKTKQILNVEGITGKLPRFGFCEVVRTSVYFFGGYDNSVYTMNKSVYKYDTVENEFYSVGSSVALIGCAAVSIGSKVYIFGGYNNSSYQVSIYKFDTETKTNVKLSAELPSPLDSAVAAAIGTDIYLFGGRNKSGVERKIYKFDSQTEKISTLAETLPETSYGLAAEAIDSKVYLFGGANAVSNITDTNKTDKIYVFDPETQKITEHGATLPSPRINIDTATVGKKVFLFDNSDIMIFGAEFDLTENHMIIVESIKDNYFMLLPNVTIGVDGVYIGNDENKGEPVEAALYKDGEWQTI